MTTHPKGSPTLTTYRRAAHTSVGLCALAWWIALAWTPSAAAEHYWLTTFGQEVSEEQHDVTLTYDEHTGDATWVVHRSFVNHGATPEELALFQMTPPGGVVTGLRVHDGQRWRRGTLMARDKADALYRFTPDDEGSNAAQPSVLVTYEGDANLLLLYPLMPGQPKHVEITMTSPARYQDGELTMAYPRIADSPGQATATIKVLPANDAHPTPRALWIEDKPATYGRAAATAPIKAPIKEATAHHEEETPFSTQDMIVVRMEAPTAHLVSGRFGQAFAHEALAATSDREAPRGVARLELEIAAQLGPTPRGATFVFVLDASHSVSADEMAAALNVMKATLFHLPDARFEVVTARRHARRVTAAPQPAGEVNRVINALRGSGALTPGNGSALDEGIVAATDILKGLRGAGDRGPHRVIALTDTRWRDKLPVASLQQQLRALHDTTLHIIHPFASPTDPHLTSMMPGAPTRLAEVTGGVAWTADGFGGPEPTDEATTTALEVVRPSRLTHVKIDGLTFDVSETLSEGQSVRRSRTISATQPQFTLRAKLWSSPITMTLRSDQVQATRAARSLFAQNKQHTLPLEVARQIADEARAVTPYTSLITSSPGARPERTLMAGLVGGVGHSLSHTYTCHIGHLGHAVVRPPLPGKAALTRTCARRHPDSAAFTHVSLEVTGDEIVDLEVIGEQSGDPGSTPTPFETCVAEAMWDLRLTEDFNQVGHSTFIVSLAP